MATNTKIKQIGKHSLVFYPDSHRYKLEGSKEWLLSPSSILGVIDKPMLIDWAVRTACEYIRQNHGRFSDIQDLLDMAKKEWRTVRDEAADYGTQVHNWIEEWIKGNTKDIPDTPEVQNGIMAFLKWQKEHNAQFVETERLVYNPVLNYAGTTDAIAIIDGKRTIVDFKTGSGVYSEAYAQLTAYWDAIGEEQSAPEIEQGLIMHLDKKTGDFTSYYLTKSEAKKYRDIFIAALRLKVALREVANGK